MNVAIQFAANWISFCKVNSLEPASSGGQLAPLS